MELDNRHAIQPTFPELWIPFITMKNTISHATIKQITIHHLKPPLSSMLAAASNVSRYQKYSVSEDFAHSSTIVPLSVFGHSAHGKGNFVEQKIIVSYVGDLRKHLLTRKLFTK